MNIEFVDSEGTEIYSKFWDNAAIKYNVELIEGQTYLIRNARIEQSNKRFTCIPHDFELRFDMKSMHTAHMFEIKESPEKIEMQKPYHLKTISQIIDNESFYFDFAFVVAMNNESTFRFQKQDGTMGNKRHIIGQDETGTVDILLWEKCAEIEFEKGDVIFVRFAKWIQAN